MVEEPDIDFVLRREHKALMALARSLVADGPSAEDLVQETWVRTLGMLPPGVRSRLQWMRAVLRHLVVDRERSEARRRDLELRSYEECRSRMDERLAFEGELVDAVKALAEPYKSTIYQRYFEDLGPSEIAARQGAPVATVKTRLQRGLALLKADLDSRHRGDRERWRAQALLVAGVLRSAPPAATFTKVAAGIAGALVAGALAWQFWPEGESAESGSTLPLAAPALESAGAARDPGGARERHAATPAATGSGSTMAARIQSEVVLRGRLVLEGGAPAVGATVRVTGTRRPARLVRSEAWIQWPCPPPSVVGDDGVFEVRFLPGGADLGVALEASLEQHGSVQWGWDAFTEPVEWDLGEVVLVAAGSIRGRLVGSLAEIVPDSWRAHVSFGEPDEERRRFASGTHARVDARTGDFLLERVAQGPASLSLVSDLGVHLDWGPVNVVAGRETFVEIPYGGPDLSRRIAVDIDRFLDLGAALDPDSIRLTAPGVEPRTATELPGGVFGFDEVDLGAYCVEISAPGFEPWIRDGIEPGKTIHAELVGGAAIELVVRDGATGAEITEYALQIEYPDAPYRSNVHQLRLPMEEPPEGARYDRLLPGDVVLHVDVPGRPRVAVPVDDLVLGSVRSVEALVPSGVVLAGVVVGEPRAGVAIELTRGDAPGQPDYGWSSSGDAHINRVTTPDAGGAFRFEGLAPGTWHLRARFGPWLVVDQVVSLAGRDVTEIELVRPASGNLRGTLLLPEDPIAQVRLVVPRSGSAPGVGVEVSREGRFFLESVPAGELEVAVSVVVDDGGASFAGTFELGTVYIEAGAELERTFDFMSRFPGAARVRVHANGRAPSFAPGEVKVFGSDPITGLGIGYGIDGLGCAAFPLEPGSYDVRVQRARVWSFTLEAPMHVVSNRDAHVEVDVVLVERTVEVRDARSDEPLVERELCWTTDLASPRPMRGRATTDAAGRLVLELPPAPVTFALSADAAVAELVSWSADLPEPLVLRLP